MSDARRSSDAGNGAEPPETADREPDRQATGVESEGPAEESSEAPTEEDAEAQAEEDAEEVGGEWHLWLAVLVVVAGVVLLFAPRSFVPELLVYLGGLLVVAGVLGWAVKWAIERSG